MSEWGSKWVGKVIGEANEKGIYTCLYAHAIY